MNFEFIVSNNSGLPIYSYKSKESKNDHALVSGFLSAVISMVEYKSDSKVDNIELQNRNIIFYKNDSKELVYILITDRKKDDKLVRKMEEIARNFEGRYDSKLVNWNGETSAFFGFDEYLKKFR